MADNDYLGNIQQQRLNQQWSNNMAWATPSWMQGDFKQGNRVSQQRYQAPNAGVSQSWRGGEIRDTRTKAGVTAEAVDRIGQGFVSRNLNRQAQAQQAQQKQQAGQNFATQYQALATKAQYQAAFQKAPAPTLPTAPLQAPASNATPYNPALGVPMGQNPTSVSLKSGIGQVNQNLANWKSPAPTLPSTQLQAPAPNAKPFQGKLAPPTSRTKARGKGWK